MSVDVCGEWVYSARTHAYGKHGLVPGLIGRFGGRGEVLAGHLENDKDCVEDEKDCGSGVWGVGGDSPASIDLGRMGLRRCPSG